MIKLVVSLLFLSLFSSCSPTTKGFELENFKNTPLWELAQAVGNDDADLIEKILLSGKLNIDYKEPFYHQTLLTLAIVNEKEEAFIALLKAKANPNSIVGKNQDSSPLIEAIAYQENCNMFYIKNLLEYGANPNQAVYSTNGTVSASEGHPLLAACIHNGNGFEDDCLETIQILVKYGADVNCCSQRPINDDLCEGVIFLCLTTRNMINLRYFVIERKVKIPEVVYITGGGDKSSQKKYSLAEILNTEDFQFEDFEDEIGKQTFSREREIRNEILEYLQKTN